MLLLSLSLLFLLLVLLLTTYSASSKSSKLLYNDEKTQCLFKNHFCNKILFCFDYCFLLQNPVQAFGLAFIFSLSGYLGITFVLTLVRTFGALLAVTGKEHKSLVF